VNLRALVLRNTSLSFAASLTARAASALLFLLLARAAGPEPSGIFSLGTTYLAIFAALLWGLDELTVREVARDLQSTGRYFTHLLAVRVLLTVLSVGALVVIVRVAGYSATTVAFLSVFGWSLVPDGLSAVMQALFTAHRRLEVPFAVGLLMLAVKLGGGIWALSTGAGLGGIAVTWVAGSAAGALLYLLAVPLLLRPRLVSLAPFDRVWWAQVLTMVAPFMAISVTTILEWQLDTLLLSVFKGEREIGWYSAALTIFVTLWLIPQAYRAAIFPEMARLQADAPSLERLYARSMELLLALALPIAAGLSLTADRLVPFLYKGDFGPSVPVLQVLSWVLVPLFLNVPGVRVLLVKERQDVLARYVTASLVVNAAANLLLIPNWGIMGATAARALSTGTFYVLHLIALRPYVPGFSLARAAARPALATAGMALAVWLAGGMHVLAVVAIGAVVYVGLAYALRIWDLGFGI
jgi:O-antigen/teichoic acid export membrane protein